MPVLGVHRSRATVELSGDDAYGPIPDNAPVAFVGRYVSVQQGKCITKAELAGYYAAGKKVLLVGEDNATDGTGGLEAGEEKAKLWLPIIETLELEAGRPVHFAFDMPGYSYYLPSFYDCTMAFAEGIDREPAAYGDVDTCTYLHDRGVKYLWQFGEGRAPGITVYQSPSLTAPWGQLVDPDEALAYDYGQTPFTEEDPVTTHDISVPAGKHFAETTIPFAKVGAHSLRMPDDGVAYSEVSFEEMANGNTRLVCVRTPNTSEAVVRVLELA